MDTRNLLRDGGLYTSCKEAEAFVSMYAALYSTLRAFAESLTRDAEHQDDLIGEAIVALWNLGPTRFDRHDASQLELVRGVMLNRMTEAWKADANGFRALADALSPENTAPVDAA